MKAHTASLINAVTLIVCTAWAYLAIPDIHFTAFIPGAIGLALIACYPGVKAENKIVAHIAVSLTALLLISLFIPLRSSFGYGEFGPIFRTLAMIGTTVFAMVYFIKSFRDARRARA
ncbi:MAG: hypothetical protein AAGG56_06680 [Pseudomonadota bacterium]